MVGRTADLEARLAYLAAAVATSDDAVLSLDVDGRVTSWNRGAERLFDLADGRLEQLCAVEIVAPQDRAEWQRVLAQARGGIPTERQELHVLRGESSVPARFAVTPVCTATGEVIGVSLVVRDLEEQALAQATLAENARRVAESEALAQVGSWVWDAGSGAVQWSEELHRIHGIEPGQFDNSLAGHLAHVHPSDRLRVSREMQIARRSALPFSEEFRLVRPDGSVRRVYANATLVVGPQGEGLGLRGIYHDVTSRHDNAQVLREANSRLSRLAMYDPLTGLPNRVLLVDRIGQGLARARSLGATFDLIYLGVDDFTTLTDSAGHTAGDQVLTALAPILRQAVDRAAGSGRGSGGLLARLRGDEFAVVLDGGDPSSTAESIHELLERPLHLPDDQVFVTVSIGNAQVSATRSDAVAEDVITEANIAMRVAKRVGKGRFVRFEPQMYEAARSRHQLGHDLHQALAEEQFVVHYQPVVDLASGVVTGAEALVRWQHPTRGLVGPDSFITRAEETGLIAPLGVWVLRQACLQAASWQRDTGRPFTVAVNVSGRQLRDHDFVDAVRLALHDSALPPELLCLEMTESILMERDDGALEILTALRDDGSHLAIDDFGTGYSSLAALRRLPVDKLKIDRSFVAGLPDDDDAGTIAWAIVHLAHALGLGVVAEGVETLSQRAELLRFGGDQGQGFLFGRALPASEFAELVANSAGQGSAIPTPRGAGAVIALPDTQAGALRGPKRDLLI